MNLSNSGRIIVMDDRYADEAKPLLDALSINNLPFIFFDGKPDNLPKEPLTGIRFVFLDIELQGLEGQPPKTKASGVMARLEKIISTKNGPYVLIAWAKHSDETISLILENCTRKNIRPVFCVDMEKNSCLRKFQRDGIMAVTERINEKLDNLGAFHLYVDWENLISDSCKEFIYNIFSLFPCDENWTRNTNFLFYKIYKHYVEKNLYANKEDEIRCALTVLNRSLIDTIENSISAYTPPSSIQLSDGKIDTKIIAKIQSSMFLIYNASKLKTPGSVYINNNVSNVLIQNCIKGNKKYDKSDFLGFMIIITPTCDVAQKKVFKHRALYGIMYESDKEYKRANFDHLLKYGPVIFQDKSYNLILNIQTITSFYEHEIDDEKRIFTIRGEWLHDMQTKAANNINRIGKFELR